MSGYFTDLLLNDSIDPLSYGNDEPAFTNTESQQPSDTTLYLPKKRSMPPNWNEHSQYTTNSLSSATTVASSTDESLIPITNEQRTHTTSTQPPTNTVPNAPPLSHMDYAYLDTSAYQQQQEQLSEQVLSEQVLEEYQQGSQQVSTHSKYLIMTAIESTILEVLASISMLKPVELSFMARTLQRRPHNNGFSSSASSDPLDQDDIQDTSDPRLKVLSLNYAAGATTLTRYVRVLEVIYDALANNIMVTKRDIFYRDLPLFRTQPTVDKIVDDICCHYNVPRSSLNVSASGKGRIYGPANIILKNHRILNCLAAANDEDVDCNDEYGILIPPINQILDVECRAQIVVVIEKEASFRHLVSVGFVQMLLQQCILITGCGYPDFATRHLIKHISTRYPAMPILAVMDNDPYGLDIYSVYKWGSLAQAHDSVNLTIPSMKLLGLGYDDRKLYGISDLAYTPLTSKDREKGIRMIIAAQQLQRSQNSSLEHKTFILELCKVLHLNQKCELQALVTDGPLGFIDYLRMKIENYIDSAYCY